MEPGFRPPPELQPVVSDPLVVVAHVSDISQIGDIVVNEREPSDKVGYAQDDYICPMFLLRLTLLLKQRRGW